MKLIKKLFSKYKSSQGLRAAAFVSSGNVVGTSISAIAIIILSRVLGPSNFGTFSAAFSLLILLTNFADLGINIAFQRYVVRKRALKHTSALSMIKATLIIKLFLLSTIALFGFFFSDIISVKYLHIDSTHIIRATFLLVSITVLHEFISITLQAFHKFRGVVAITLIPSLGKLLFAVLLLTQREVTTDIAYLGYASMPLLGIVSGIYIMPKGIQKVDIDIKGNAKKLYKVARWTGISIISAAVAGHFDTLIIKNMLTSYQTGLWAAASRIASFVGTFAISFGMVLNVRVAAYKQKEHIDAYIKKAKIFASTSFFAIVAIIPMGEIGILLTTGSEYVSATPALSLLLVSTALMTATVPFMALFYRFNKPKFYAIEGIILAVIIIIGDFFLIPKLGLVGAGYAKIVARGGSLLFTVWYAKRTYRELYAKK